MTKTLIAFVALVLSQACAGQVETTDPVPPPPVTCTQVGSSFVWGQGTFLRYECDADPGEDCEQGKDGVYECPAALTQAIVVCPQ